MSQMFLFFFKDSRDDGSKAVFQKFFEKITGENGERHSGKCKA